MADPLSMATAVITLATALKDLAELAQKIRESFKKPARNKRAVEALAAETLDIVIGLKDLYEGHKEKLENVSDMRDAVLKLLTDMNAVYHKCRPILQDCASSDRRLRIRIKQKIDAWWNRDDLEEQIRNLRDMANRYDRQFMRHGMMRIETATAQIQATTVEIQTTTVQIRSAVANGFAHVHEHMSSLRVSDQNTLAFLGSVPVILSTLPPHVQLSERLVYKSYITVQVGKVENLFKALASRGSYPSEEPDSLHLESFWSVVNLKPFTNEEMKYVESNIFALIVKIQESLESGRQLAIQRGADAMSDLFVWLSNLRMAQESLTIAQCTVNLYRTLTKTHEDVYGPRLAHALRLMSLRYVDTGDALEAYKLITEAVIIGRRLVVASPTFEAKMQLAKLLSCAAYVGRGNGDWTKASKDAEGALLLYQCLVEVPTSMLRTEAEIVRGTEIEAANVHNLADALAELHYSLSETTRRNESVKAGRDALELYMSLQKRYKQGGFSHKIADLFSSLASDKFREIVPIEQALMYAQESARHYEEVLQKPGVVPSNLSDTLGLERFDEEYGVRQKRARMIRIQIDNQEFGA